MSIGRTPDAAVFLDDVTVSRNHALLVRRQDGYYIDDLGSLNGTYVNRRRIESHRLSTTATRSRSASTSSATWRSEGWTMAVDDRQASDRRRRRRSAAASAATRGRARR